MGVVLMTKLTKKEMELLSKKKPSTLVQVVAFLATVLGFVTTLTIMGLLVKGIIIAWKWIL
jgi:hypothetical protein